ncbi:DNA mismatch repair protein MutT [Parafrankia soli]|uniref:DNA mismatch repair protein MutT n=1 Tax=Parafrankia soli TaxID=2599596 RepID=A0A1S1QYG7_9ACTN|nr:NUDIX hydrolase [Parafrankia soli]OHV39738.1 DNA mismatch repair protein MutT [Parafrankia soli]
MQSPGDTGGAAAPRFLRVGAYAVCVRDDHLLLARFSPGDPAGVRWTLPGGGLDHGEHPEQGAIREVREETGHDVELTGLLGIDSIHYLQRDGTDFHGLRVLYSARVVGGTLRHEIGGSTDLAAWIPLADVPALDRIALVDIALDLARGADRIPAAPGGGADPGDGRLVRVAGG